MTKPELVVAPLTPFTSDLKIDVAALKREIDYVVADCGATMVVAAGVEAQEYTYLGLAERKDLIAAHDRIRRGALPGDGRHLPSVVQDGARARAFRPGPGRRTRCRCWRRCGPSAGRRPSATWSPISRLWRGVAAAA